MSLPEPITRKEQYYDGIAKGNASKLPEPITREEQYLEYIAKNGGGGGGTTDYEALDNKPSVNSVELSGNKTLDDLGVQGKLKFDNEPTEDSQNPVKSGGVYESLASINEAISSKPDEYADLTDKPSINDVTLSGNKTASDLGLQPTLDGAQTVEGNPITVTDAEPMNAESVKVELEPKQDLHGYDKPWAGGASKNLLPMTVDGIKALNTDGTWSGNVYSINGGTVEILTDSDSNVVGLKVNGTFNANIFLQLSDEHTGGYDFLSLNTPYVINGGVSGIGVRAYHYNGPNIATSYGSDAPFTLTSYDGAGRNIDVKISLNITFNDAIIYPMIRLSTETDPTFEPYTNICPISGYSEVNVENNTDTYTVSLGGTKYGGVLDVTDGGYSDEWGYYTIDGNTVAVESSQNGTYVVNEPSGMVITATDQQVEDMMCDSIQPNSITSVVFDNTYGIAVSTTSYFIFLRLPSECGSNASEVNTWLQSNPISIAYHKTPSSVSTTPTDITLLENTNNISSDGTNITLKYQPNNVIGECKQYTDEQITKVLPPLPTTDGTYHLSCEVTSGVGVLSWVSDS